MLGRSLAISPGVRTMPAAMVLPTAAAMPNHMPRTWRRRPRFFAERAELVADASPVVAAPLRSMPAAVAGASDVLDNGASRESICVWARVCLRDDGVMI